MTINTFTFEGTAKDFENQSIKLNGKLLDQVTVNALARHGLIETVGEGPKPARGRTPMKYRAVSNECMTFDTAVNSEVK